ncbi:hypothetical protein RFI_20035, partial [Reticulomyxa filosa]
QTSKQTNKKKKVHIEILRFRRKKLKQIIIGIRFPEELDESVDDTSNENMNAMDRLGQFPWHSIRKWHMDGIQLQILYSYIMQRPVLLYRSVFDKSSDSDWRQCVLCWKRSIEDGKSPFEKWYASNYKDIMGANHGCIYYSPQDVQFEETLYSTGRRQMISIKYSLNDFVWISAKLLCNYTSDRAVFCIQNESFDKLSRVPYSLNECSPFRHSFYFSLQKKKKKKKKKKTKKTKNKNN